MVGKSVLNELTAYQQGMQIADVKKKYKLDRIVKLASNENPYGYSKKVDEFLNDVERDFELYPDGYAAVLREKLAQKLSLSEKQLVFGAGSDEIITFVCRAFLYPGVNTVMATPTFTQYRHHALIEGAEIKEIPTENGRHNLTNMLDAIDDGTKVVWICSPDNPTGELIEENELKTFLDKCPEDVIVVLDAAYYEFIDEERRYDLNELLENYPNLIVLRTFSKIYGLAGFRVGYAMADEKVAHQLNVVRGPFNTTSIGQRVATVALDDDEFLRNTKRANKQVRSAFEQFLKSIGWGYYESHTNFLLVKTPIDADEVALYLLKNGFIVRSGNLLGYPNTVRITIGKQEDMLSLQTVIKKLQQEIDDGVIK